MLVGLLVPPGFSKSRTDGMCTEKDIHGEGLTTVIKEASISNLQPETP